MTLQEIKIVAIIPVHLASVRFPRKALLNIKGIPMVEHVRRRALLSFDREDVYIATCDDEIAKHINGIGGNSILTSASHTRATSRTAEAMQIIEEKFFFYFANFKISIFN